MSSKNSIKLSPEHGLNPSIMQCPICHKDIGIALLGKLKGDVEAPKVIENELCDDCKKVYVTIHENDGKRYTGKIAYLKKDCLREDFRKYDHLAMLPSEFEQMRLNMK